MSSVPEIDALVARVGLAEALTAVRAWIGQQDALIFLRNFPPAAQPPAPGTEDEELAPSLAGNPCPCGENRGADCDCHEDGFRERDEDELPLRAGGGGAALCATASGAGTGLCATPSTAGMTQTASGGWLAPSSAAYDDERERSSTPRVEDCELHGPMQSGGLWYSPNSSGYSTTSPPCNGCRDGQRDAANGLWMSGFGQRRNVFYSRDGQSFQPLYPTPAALGATTSVGVGESLVRLQTMMLECLQLAEMDPHPEALDTLLNAMDRFRAAGGGDGDNYRYCEERYRALRTGR